MKCKAIDVLQHDSVSVGIVSVNPWNWSFQGRTLNILKYRFCWEYRHPNTGEAGISKSGWDGETCGHAPRELRAPCVQAGWKDFKRMESGSLQDPLAVPAAPAMISMISNPGLIFSSRADVRTLWCRWWWSGCTRVLKIDSWSDGNSTRAIWR